MRTKPFLVFGILLAGAIASAQTPLLPAPHRHVTTVSPAEVRANEPSIAVNPNNPNQVVAAFQPAGIAYSTDGGQTFGLADLPAIEGWRGARIPRIARPLLLSHAPLTEERPSSTSRGKRLHLKPRERLHMAGGTPTQGVRSLDRSLANNKDRAVNWATGSSGDGSASWFR